MKTIKQLMGLKGRIALITGGGGHLGSSMAEGLAEAGCQIILLDADGKNCLKKANVIKKKYKVRVLPVIVDLENEEAIRSVPLLIRNEMKRLDILINCAALVNTTSLKGWAVPFKNQHLDTWRKALEVNLTAPFALIQACQKLLGRSQHASVINIGSIYGVVGPDMGLYKGTALGNAAAYGVSKGGLIQLTRWLSTVLAPNIRVNAISIGGVYRNHKDPFLSRYLTRTPLKRMAVEEDIKGAALYLASDLSKYVTGHNLMVDGGFSAW